MKYSCDILKLVKDKCDNKVDPSLPTDQCDDYDRTQHKPEAGHPVWLRIQKKLAQVWLENKVAGNPRVSGSAALQWCNIHMKKHKQIYSSLSAVTYITGNIII